MVSSPYVAQSQESCDATASKSDHNQLHVYTVNIQCKKSAQVRLELASGHGHHVYMYNSFIQMFVLSLQSPTLSTTLPSVSRTCTLLSSALSHAWRRSFASSVAWPRTSPPPPSLGKSLKLYYLHLLA